MKNPLITFLLSFIFFGNIFAQLSTDLVTSSSKTMNITVQENPNKLYFLVSESFPLKDNRNLFLNPEFKNAIIIDFEDETFEVQFRYRLADDEMQIIHLGKIKALYPQKIKQLTFKENGIDKIFIPKEYIENESKNLGYFELLTAGKLSLLKSFQRNKKGKIKISYFFQKENIPAKFFKLKKSSILKIMSCQKSEVSKFIVKNNLNVKKENDLKQIFDFYNSLF